MSRLGALGFIGGAAGQALKALESRQDEEREMRKAKMLESLRRDTAIYLADYQDKLEAKKVDKDTSGFDPATGEFISRNSKGEEIGRRADKGMQEEYEFGKKKNQMSLDVAAANIRQSDASAEASRASAANSRANAGLASAQAKALAGGADGFTLDDRANELLHQYKVVVNDATASGVPAEQVANAARFSMAEAASRGMAPSQANTIFLQTIASLRERYKGSKNTNVTKVKSLDSMFLQPED